MPKSKERVHETLMEIARDEMLAKGYSGALIRDIAGKAQMMPPSLYRHFSNKEGIFEALVSQAVQALDSFWAEKEKIKIDTAADYAPFGDSSLEELLDVVYRYESDFRLLTCSSAGTKYESFWNQLSEKKIQSARKRFPELYEEGSIQPEIWHIAALSYAAAIGEIISSDCDRAQASKHLQSLHQLLSSGWMNICSHNSGEHTIIQEPTTNQGDRL